MLSLLTAVIVPFLPSSDGLAALACETDERKDAVALRDADFNAALGRTYAVWFRYSDLPDPAYLIQLGARWRKDQTRAILGFHARRLGVPGRAERVPGALAQRYFVPGLGDANVVFTQDFTGLCTSNEWHHAVLVSMRTSARFYLDGKRVAEIVHTTPLPESAGIVEARFGHEGLETVDRTILDMPLSEESVLQWYREGRACWGGLDRIRREM